MKYRTRRYQYKAWLIEEYKYNKKKDTWEWVTIKYPGNMVQAIEGIIDLCIEEGKPYEDLLELKNDILAIRQTVTDSIIKDS